MIVKTYKTKASAVAMAAREQHWCDKNGLHVTISVDKVTVDGRTLYPVVWVNHDGYID